MKHISFFFVVLLLFTACTAQKDIQSVSQKDTPQKQDAIIPEIPVAASYSFAQQATAAQEAAKALLEKKLGDRNAISVTFQTASIGDTIVYGYALRNLYNYKTNFIVKTTFNYHQIPIGSSFSVENQVMNEWVDAFSQQNITLNEGEVKLIPLIIHVKENVSSEQETLPATYYFTVSTDAYQRTLWKEYAEKEFSVKIK